MNEIIAIAGGRHTIIFTEGPTTHMTQQGLLVVPQAEKALYKQLLAVSLESVITTIVFIHNIIESAVIYLRF